MDHYLTENTTKSTLKVSSSASHQTETSNSSLELLFADPDRPQEIPPYHYLGGPEVASVPVLTEIIYGGSCVHILIMLHVDDNVKVSLHVVSVAVALWPHDICKGSGETKNTTLLIRNTTACTCHMPSTLQLDKRQSHLFQRATIPVRDRQENTEVINLRYKVILCAGHWLST